MATHRERVVQGDQAIRLMFYALRPVVGGIEVHWKRDENTSFLHIAWADADTAALGAYITANQQNLANFAAFGGSRLTVDKAEQLVNVNALVWPQVQHVDSAEVIGERIRLVNNGVPVVQPLPQGSKSWKVSDISADLVGASILTSAIIMIARTEVIPKSAHDLSIFVIIAVILAVMCQLFAVMFRYVYAERDMQTGNKVALIFLVLSAFFFFLASASNIALTSVVPVRNTTT